MIFLILKFKRKTNLFLNIRITSVWIFRSIFSLWPLYACAKVFVWVLNEILSPFYHFHCLFRWKIFFFFFFCNFICCLFADKLKRKINKKNYLKKKNKYKKQVLKYIFISVKGFFVVFENQIKILFWIISYFADSYLDYFQK